MVLVCVVPVLEITVQTLLNSVAAPIRYLEDDVVESDVVESDAVESDAVETDVVETDVVETDVVTMEAGLD